MQDPPPKNNNKKRTIPCNKRTTSMYDLIDQGRLITWFPQSVIYFRIPRATPVIQFKHDRSRHAPRVTSHLLYSQNKNQLKNVLILCFCSCLSIFKRVFLFVIQQSFLSTSGTHVLLLSSFCFCWINSVRLIYLSPLTLLITGYLTCPYYTTYIYVNRHQSR